MLVEAKKRSVLKAVSWRIVCLIVAFVIADIFIGDHAESAYISIATNSVNFVLYYLHERFWNRISWGRRVV